MLGRQRAFVVPICVGALIAGSVGAKWLVEQGEPKQWQVEQAAKNSHDEKALDILASLRVAYYTKVLAGLTGALAVFGAGQAFFLIRGDRTARMSAEAALKSAKVAEDSLRIGSRPWLIPTTIEIRTVEFRDGGQIVAEVKTHIRNSGSLPATNVRVVYQIIELHGGKQPAAALDEIITNAATDHAGLIIYPGDPFIPPGWSVISSRETLEAKYREQVQLFLVGSIIYKFALSDELHHTPFIGNIWRTGPRALVVGQSYDLGDLIFSPIIMLRTPT